MQKTKLFKDITSVVLLFYNTPLFFIHTKKKPLPRRVSSDKFDLKITLVNHHLRRIIVSKKYCMV